jgi:hypothetical protein
MKDKYIKDEEKEEIIIQISTKIRYFTPNTIKKYNNCLDFLNSLEKSVCVKTKIKISNLIFMISKCNFFF